MKTVHWPATLRDAILRGRPADAGWARHEHEGSSLHPGEEALLGLAHAKASVTGVVAAPKLGASTPIARVSVSQTSPALRSREASGADAL